MTKTDYALQLLGHASNWRRDVQAASLSAAINTYMHDLEREGAVYALNDGDTYDISVLVHNKPLHAVVTVNFKPTFKIDILNESPATGQQSLFD